MSADARSGGEARDANGEDALWPVGRGAVLYEDQPDTPADERRLHHVTARLVDPDSGDRLLRIWDGTHTTKRYCHADDVLAEFTPGGWQWPVGRKPTYHLSRECGVDDRADHMTPGTESGAGTESDEDLLVSNAAEIPRMDGQIPWWNSDDRPPETVLDAYWQCPHCRERMPTLYDLWRLYRNRDRCAARRNEQEQGSREWHAYNEGVHHYRKRIESVTNGLDDATRKWARDVITHEF